MAHPAAKRTPTAAVPKINTIREQLRNVKKGRILDEARKLFYAHGFRGTSLDAIAESMGVTKPFVCGVYDKKTDILFGDRKFKRPFFLPKAPRQGA